VNIGFALGASICSHHLVYRFISEIYTEKITEHFYIIISMILLVDGCPN